MTVIQDGFGESHTLEDYLRARESLLSWKAARDEELVQEARIAVWLTLAKHPDATRSYLDQAATWRIRDLQRGAALTGETRPHGGKDVKPDPLRAPHEPEDALTELAAACSLQELDLAYHHGQIMQAIAELPVVHREYVVLRFWGGFDRTEIGRALHRNPGNLATTWRTQIQPRLAAQLAHLVTV